MYIVSTDHSFYVCRGDIIYTDNSFMHAGVTSFYLFTISCNVGFTFMGVYIYFFCSKILDLQLYNKTILLDLIFA